MISQSHALGERPLLEFFIELAADPVTRVDIELNLARYAKLDPEIVAALGGRELHPPLVVIDDDTVLVNQTIRGAA